MRLSAIFDRPRNPATIDLGPVLEDERVVGRLPVAFAEVSVGFLARSHEQVCVVFPYGRNFSSFARARGRG